MSHGRSSIYLLWPTLQAAASNICIQTALTMDPIVCSELCAPSPALPRFAREGVTVVLFAFVGVGAAAVTRTASGTVFLLPPLRSGGGLGRGQIKILIAAKSIYRRLLIRRLREKFRCFS